MVQNSAEPISGPKTVRTKDRKRVVCEWFPPYKLNAFKLFVGSWFRFASGFGLRVVARAIGFPLARFRCAGTVPVFRFPMVMTMMMIMTMIMSIVIVVIIMVNDDDDKNENDYDDVDDDDDDEDDDDDRGAC